MGNCLFCQQSVESNNEGIQPTVSIEQSVVKPTVLSEQSEALPRDKRVGINSYAIHPTEQSNETVKPTISIEQNNNVIESFDDLMQSSSDTKEFSLAGQTHIAKVVYVYDGDTVHCVVKINNTITKFNCRLLGIDSPEIAPKNVMDKEARQNEINSAIKSRNYLIERVTDQKVDENMSKKDIKELCKKSTKLVTIKCHEFDKYGRLLVEIFNDINNKSINQDMIDNKYAVAYDGGTKKEYSIENFNF